MGDRSHVSTRVMGTYGYAAPEYVITGMVLSWESIKQPYLYSFLLSNILHLIQKGHLTEKSDVFSFGVVVMEVLAGRRVLDRNRPNNEMNLVEWAKPYISNKRKILRVVDPRLEGQCSLIQALKLGKLALSCLETNPKRRPTMAEVVTVLEQLNQQNDPNVGENTTPIQQAS